MGKETNLRASIRRNSVVLFIVLTLGLSLATFVLPIPPENAFALIASILVLIPTLVAFVLVAEMEDRPGLCALMSEIFNWRVALACNPSSPSPR